MILLETAASRVANALAPLGISCAPERSLQESAVQIRRLTSNLDPITLPSELRDFWVWWAPERFTRPAFDGFLSPSEALACRQGMVDIGFPSMLIPVAKYGKGMIWAELQSPAHPGSRIYFGSYAHPDLRLWTIGISGLLEVLADVLETGGVISWTGNEHHLDSANLQSVLSTRRAELDWPHTQWTIPIADETRWPQHWKAGASN